MALPFEQRTPIPTTEPERLRSAARRTAVLRAVLALGLVPLLGAAVLVARSIDPRHAPLVPSGTTGMLVLDLSASVYEDAFGQTIRKLARSGERTAENVLELRARETADALAGYVDEVRALYPPATPPLTRVADTVAGVGGSVENPVP